MVSLPSIGTLLSASNVVEAIAAKGEGKSRTNGYRDITTFVDRWSFRSATNLKDWVYFSTCKLCSHSRNPLDQVDTMPARYKTERYVPLCVSQRKRGPATASGPKWLRTLPQASYTHTGRGRVLASKRPSETQAGSSGVDRK